jgi:WD40 repeat protein
VRALAVAHGTSRVYSGDHSGEIIVWNARDGSIFERIGALKSATTTDTRVLEVPRGPEWPAFVGGVESAIHSIAVSDDGCVLVVSQGKHVQVLDLSRGKEIRKLSGHSDRIQCVTVSPDGRRALTASHDGAIRLWDILSETCLAAFTSDRALYSCAMSPDLQTILAGEAGSGKVHFLRLVESAQ